MLAYKKIIEDIGLLCSVFITEQTIIKTNSGGTLTTADIQNEKRSKSSCLSQQN